MNHAFQLLLELLQILLIAIHILFVVVPADALDASLCESTMYEYEILG